MLNEVLCQEAYDLNLNVQTYPLLGKNEALLVGNIIYLNNSIESGYKKNRLICHEMEHANSCPFNLVRAPESTQRKFEAIAERRAAKKLVPLDKLTFLYIVGGLRCPYDFAESLEVDEEYFVSVLQLYQQMYGDGHQHGGYTVNFMPLRII